MLKLQAETTLPTDFGNFKLLAFSEKEEDWMPHLALIAEGTELDTVTISVFILSVSQVRFFTLENVNADSN